MDQYSPTLSAALVGATASVEPVVDAQLEEIVALALAEPSPSSVNASPTSKQVTVQLPPSSLTYYSLL